MITIARLQRLILLLIAPLLLASMLYKPLFTLQPDTPSTQSLDTNVYVIGPSGVVNGLEPAVYLVKGGDVAHAEANVTLKADVYLYEGLVRVKQVTFSEKTTLDLPILRVWPGAHLVLVPPPPVQVVRYKSSSFEGYVNVTAVIRVNITVSTPNGLKSIIYELNYTPLYKLVEDRPYPVWKPSRLIPFINQSPIAAVAEGEPIRLCGFAVGGLKPKLNVTLSLAPGGSWNTVLLNVGKPPHTADEASLALNVTLNKLLDTVWSFVKPSSHDKVNYTGPSVSTVCADIDVSSKAGSTLLFRFEAGGVKTPTILVYVYSRDAGIRVGILDPLLYHLALLNTPNVTFYASIPWITKMPLYEKLFNDQGVSWAKILSTNFTAYPIPLWGALGVQARLILFDSWDFNPSETSVDVLVYAPPFIPPPGFNVTKLIELEESIARGAMEGRYALVVAGPIGTRLNVTKNGTSFKIRVVEAHSLLLQSVLGLGSLIALEKAGVETLCPYAATLYTPPITPSPGTIAATSYASELLGLPKDFELTVEGPIGVEAASLGYRIYNAPDWLFEAGFHGEALTAYTSDSMLIGVEEVLGFYAKVIGFKATAVLDALNLLPKMASSLYTGVWKDDTLDVKLPGCGDVEASIPETLLELIKRNPLPLPLFTGPDGAAIVVRPLCSSGVYVIYSSLPLEYSREGSGLLAVLTLWAAGRKPSCKNVLGFNTLLDLELPSRYRIATSTVLLLQAGGRSDTVISATPGEYVLLVAQLDAGLEKLRVYINGSLVKPFETRGVLLLYRLEGHTWLVSVEALGAETQPKRVLVALAVEPETVTFTETTTTTEIVTKTVVRNVTVPSGVVTRTVTETVTLSKTITKTVTRVEKRVETRTVTETRVYTETLTVTSTTTVYNVSTIVSTIYRVVTPPTSTVTSVKTVMVERTVTVPKPVTVTSYVLDRVRLGASLGAGLAGGVAVGFLASRLLARRRGGG